MSHRYPNIAARILANILEDANDPYCLDHGACWLWQLHCDQKGYGRLTVRVNGKPYGFRVHRVGFEVFTGVTIPDDMTLDHLCRRTACCRPSHLEIVSRSVNSLRKVRAYQARSPAYDALLRQLALWEETQVYEKARVIETPA